ncbi:cation efflux family-domain-containing protein [Gilbertella persicaria]|uniref:cation efflux family-domain-containing protein n=1 Tax=Gilbertella persicaria TaxID=101096 RepID=UPI00222121D9|nr:cation efflux family-domain-containing protein [Gilbertella persicaria]KAI8098017.1 cation efflux family-domain-containing protein [Gilbertella persicaria]
MSCTQTIELVQLKQRPFHKQGTHEEDLHGSSQDPLALERKKMADDYIKNLKKSKLQQFYQNQNDLIDTMLTALDKQDAEKEQQQLFKLKLAIYGSVVANIVLFVLQLVAAVTSGSLSIFSTMADAFMDLLSSVVLMWATKQASKSNLQKYPAGKSRMETIGIIIFSCLMSCVALFLIIEASQKLADKSHSPDLTVMAIAFVSAALAVKLILYVYCKTLSSFSSAKILAQDHRNDLLVNGLGLTTGIVGSRIAPWVDPAGSIIIALIILQSWVITLLEHIPLVVGKSADTQFLNLITYIALTHPGVVQVDNCLAYYAGNNLFVEVDIVLPSTMELRESHDIGEALQNKLESLPDVERAFVHADYETMHKREHQKSQ